MRAWLVPVRTPFPEQANALPQAACDPARGSIEAEKKAGRTLLFRRAPKALANENLFLFFFLHFGFLFGFLRGLFFSFLAVFLGFGLLLIRLLDFAFHVRRRKHGSTGKHRCDENCDQLLH
jgi:hypothetical protein